MIYMGKPEPEFKDYTLGNLDPGPGSAFNNVC